MSIIILALLGFVGFIGIFALVQSMLKEQKELNDIARVLNDGAGVCRPICKMHNLDEELK
jgi:hypothetical protein